MSFEKEERAGDLLYALALCPFAHITNAGLATSFTFPLLLQGVSI